MFKRILRHGAIAALLVASIYPQISFATEFTSAEFLKWKRGSQASYIQTSVGMAAVIAAQLGNGQAKCIADWYFSNPERRKTSMLKSMSENQKFHPQGVILAFIQKHCGSIGK